MKGVKVETKERMCLCIKIEKKDYNCEECLYLLKMVSKVKQIIDSPQSGYEKRIALFDYLESLDVGELKPNEKKRIDYLLQSRLYSELAKQSMKQYKKLTAEKFSKVE
jgi:hypothetical protein